MMAIRQIPDDEVRAPLRPVALLRIPLEEIAQASGVSFETQHGNLGKQLEASLEADDGSQYMLVQFCEGPTRDIELRADTHQADVGAAVTRFLEAFALPGDAVIWRLSPEDSPSNSSLREGESSGDVDDDLEDLLASYSLTVDADEPLETMLVRGT